MTEQPTEEPVVVEETTVEETPVAVEPAPPAAPLLEPPPVQESLAEQVQREARELPDSQSPSDIVPNRPNIRPPVTEEEIAETTEEEVEEGEDDVTVRGQIVEPEPDGEPVVAEHQSAADLIAAAQAAETAEELDAIEAQAENRVTVLDAVDKRRQELGV